MHVSACKNLAESEGVDREHPADATTSRVVTEAFGPTFGPDTGALAEELLLAVDAGDPRSADLAGRLARAVLDDPMVRRALALEELLRTRSPFALVRAVELAEELMDLNASPSPLGIVRGDRR